MASLLPLISEILPMIMPGTTHVTRARDMDTETPRADGPVVVKAAVVDKCDKMSATVVTIRPGCETPIQHNSEQEAIMYIVSGHGVLVCNEGFEAELREHEVAAGDFAVVPAWTEHQARNGSDAADLVCVVVHGGPRPVGATLTGWGGDETDTRA